MRPIIGLCLTLILLAGCAPAGNTSESIQVLKAACNNACKNEPQTVGVTLRAGSEIYTTEEAVCIKTDEKRLYCGTCGCGTYGLVARDVLIVDQEQFISCTFRDDGELTLACA